MDAANWLAHHADHRLNALWRFHALHHSQEELSVLTSFRAHPLMHTTGFLLATVPVVALMPARPIASVLITIYVCIGTLQHANLSWTFGPVGRVGRTGLDGRPVPVEQDGSAGPALLLFAEQLTEPFQAQRS